jgi:glycine C-acetyltransferase
MKESAYLLNFGYQGIMSTIDALVTRNDIIVYDVDAHACIIDGVRLHSGIYLHNDLESMEKNLQRATKWLLKQVVVFCLLPKVFFYARTTG